MSFFDVTLITEPLITVCKILSAVCVKSVQEIEVDDEIVLKSKENTIKLMKLSKM